MGENKKGLVIIVRVKMHFKHTEGEVKEVGWEKGVYTFCAFGRSRSSICG